MDMEESPCDVSSSEGTRIFMLSNSSLRICALNQSDVGQYHCKLSTDLEKAISGEINSIFLVSTFPWWILIVIILVLLLLFLLVCVCCIYRKRKTGKGYYGMDVEDGGKHNKSDIYYTTEDAESIMNEMDNTYDSQYAQAKTPIFTPKTIRHLARVDKSIGSIGSLLDDDEFLDKGYQEDGSFRERYAE